MKLVIIAIALMSVCAVSATKLDGSQVTSLYNKAIAALASGDKAAYDAVVSEDAVIMMLGYGIPTQCTPIHRDAAFGHPHFFNVSRAIPSRIMAAYDTMVGTKVFAGLVAKLNKPPIVSDILVMARCDPSNCTKLTEWIEISTEATSPTAQLQLQTTQLINEAWSTANVKAYTNVFADDVRLSFAYEGAATKFVQLDHPMFVAYANSTFPTEGPSAQPPITQASGGCNMLAIRSLMIQSKLNGKGTAAIQDSIMFVEMHATPPYKWKKVRQVLQPPQGSLPPSPPVTSPPGPTATPAPSTFKQFDCPQPGCNGVCVETTLPQEQCLKMGSTGSAWANCDMISGSETLVLTEFLSSTNCTGSSQERRFTSGNCYDTDEGTSLEFRCPASSSSSRTGRGKGAAREKGLGAVKSLRMQ